MITQEDLLMKKLAREKAARLQAEKILEDKSRELFRTNLKLQHLNETLESEVLSKTLELSIKEKEYSLLFENASDTICTSDEKGQLLSINKAGIELFGYTPSEIKGKHSTDFVHPDHKDRILNHYLELYQNVGYSSYMEFPIMTKSGEEIWVGQKLTRIDRIDDSYFYSAVLRDITERRRQELRLKRSEEKYRSMMDNMRLGLMEVDKNGLIQKAYQRFCDMVGYTAEELIGKNATELFLEEEDKAIMNNNDVLRKQGKEGVYEIRIKCKDGSKKWILISGTPFYDENGEFIGTLGIHYDISNRKKLETELIEARQIAEKAQEAEKEYLANMSHEIRNPIQGIIGMTELLQNTQLDKVQRDYLKNIKSASDILSALVSDVLDLTKIDNGQVDINSKAFKIQEVFESLEDFAYARLRNSSVSFLSSFDPKIPDTLVGDRIVLNQILMNILGNAIKFTNTGYIQLAAGLDYTSPTQAHLNISIKDTGIGIQESELGSIFNKYNQAGEVEKYKKAGAGLGLYIVKKLLDLMGGNVKVSSKVGEGTEFVLSIPFGLNSEKDLKVEKQESDMKCLDVLIVEDNKMNRRYLESTLNQLGHDWKSAENGEEALLLSRKHSFDIIFMDIRMPVMDGYEATRLIRSEENNPNRNVPIVALTASALLDDKEHAFNSGMNFHLTKPFSKLQLQKAIEHFFNDEDNTDGPQLSPLVNTDELENTTCGDWEMVKMMMEVFLENIESQKEEINLHLENNDKENLARILHKIKPGFGLIGFGYISKDIAEIEEYCLADIYDEAQVRKAVNALIAEINKILPLVRGSLENIKSYLQSSGDEMYNS